MLHNVFKERTHYVTKMQSVWSNVCNNGKYYRTNDLACSTNKSKLTKEMAAEIYLKQTKNSHNPNVFKLNH